MQSIFVYVKHSRDHRHHLLAEYPPSALGLNHALTGTKAFLLNMRPVSKTLFLTHGSCTIVIIIIIFNLKPSYPE